MKYYLFLFILFFSSCYNFVKKEKSKDKLEIISLEKTACFGTCPIFKITIYNNGETNYIGKKFVKKPGNHKLNLKQKEIDLILKKAKKINFQNLKKEYTENISDLPTTYIMIKNKTIKNHFGAPDKLKELETLIERIILEKLNINSF